MLSCRRLKVVTRHANGVSYAYGCRIAGGAPTLALPLRGREYNCGP